MVVEPVETPSLFYFYNPAEIALGADLFNRAQPTAAW